VEDSKSPALSREDTLMDVRDEKMGFVVNACILGPRVKNEVFSTDSMKEKNPLFGRNDFI
jgi:hypothetical protein